VGTLGSLKSDIAWWLLDNHWNTTVIGDVLDILMPARAWPWVAQQAGLYDFTEADLIALAAFANTCDVMRLYHLEAAGLMPQGSATKGLMGGLAYLIRIVQLKDKFKDGGYPGPTVS
jgi:hypothetical protein